MNTARIQEWQDQGSGQPRQDPSARENRPGASRSVRLPVIIHSVNSHWGTVYNINERRAFVAVDEPLPVDSLVEVEFFLPHRRQCLRVIGEVRWAGCHNAVSGRGTPGLVIEFWELGEEGRDHFERFVRSGLSHSSLVTRQKAI